MDGGHLSLDDATQILAPLPRSSVDMSSALDGLRAARVIIGPIVLKMELARWRLEGELPSEAREFLTEWDASRSIWRKVRGRGAAAWSVRRGYRNALLAKLSQFAAPRCESW
ncbi:hypothetical protein D8Y24_05755 [Agrococcus lahaulensis]|nr:hypothetical protein D8Y24_05755 [Agrococcus lahaulensis]